jgi:hypothetical protein
MKRKHGIILLVLAVIVAYLYLNYNVREGLELEKDKKEQKVPGQSKVPIGPTDNNPEPIGPA